MAICLSLKGCMGQRCQQRGKGHRRSFSQCRLNTTPSYVKGSGDFPPSLRRGSEPWPHHSLLCSQCAGLSSLPCGPRVILMFALELQMCDFLCLDTSPLPSPLLYRVCFYLSICLGLNSLPPRSPLERAPAAALHHPTGVVTSSDFHGYLPTNFLRQNSDLFCWPQYLSFNIWKMEIISISGMVVSIKRDADKVVCK